MKNLISSFCLCFCGLQIYSQTIPVVFHYMQTDICDMPPEGMESMCREALNFMNNNIMNSNNLNFEFSFQEFRKQYSETFIGSYISVYDAYNLSPQEIELKNFNVSGAYNIYLFGWINATSSPENSAGIVPLIAGIVPLICRDDIDEGDCGSYHEYRGMILVNKLKFDPEYSDESSQSATAGVLLAHEFGHSLGLLHPFSEKFNAENVTRSLTESCFNADRAGDKFIDTPADYYESWSNQDPINCMYTGNKLDDCGVPYSPDLQNLMTYSSNNYCRQFRTKLSEEQKSYMHRHWNQYYGDFLNTNNTAAHNNSEFKNALEVENPCWSYENGIFHFRIDCNIDENISFPDPVSFEDDSHVNFTGDVIFKDQVTLKDLASVNIYSFGTTTFEGYLDIQSNNNYLDINTNLLRLYKLSNNGVSRFKACILEREIEFIQNFEALEIVVKSPIKFGVLGGSYLLASIVNYGLLRIHCVSNIYVYQSLDLRGDVEINIPWKDINVEGLNESAEQLKVDIFGTIVILARAALLRNAILEASQADKVHIQTSERIKVENLKFYTEIGPNGVNGDYIPHEIGDYDFTPNHDFTPEWEIITSGDNHATGENKIQRISFHGGDIDMNSFMLNDANSDEFYINGTDITFNNGENEPGNIVYSSNPNVTAERNNQLDKAKSFLNGVVFNCCENMPVNIHESVEQRELETDALEGENLTIYPNPFQQTVNIVWDSEIEEEVSIELISLDGKILHNNVVTSRFGKNTYKFDAGTLKSSQQVFIKLIKLSTGEITTAKATFLKQ